VIRLIVLRQNKVKRALPNRHWWSTSLYRRCAETILCSLGDKGLGIDSAREMHVKIRTLGHGLEQCVELRIARLLGSLQHAFRANLSGRGRLRAHRSSREESGNQTADRATDHEQTLPGGAPPDTRTLQLYIVKMIREASPRTSAFGALGAD